MTLSSSPDEIVVLGLLPEPLLTRGPWVAHPDGDSPPTGGAAPLHDTPRKPVPNGMVATEPAIGQHMLSFAENELTAAELGRTVSPVLQRIASFLVAAGLAALAVVAVDRAGSLAATDSVVLTIAIAAAAACGALLTLAVVIGMRKG